MEPNVLKKLETLIERAKKLENENKNLKCCANCNNVPNGDDDINRGVCTYPQKRDPCLYCDDWKYDGLTSEEREV